MTKLNQLLQKYSYNEPYESQFGFEGSPYFHRGDEALPFNQYVPLGEATMEKPQDLDRMENHGKDGKEFPEFKEFDERKNKRLKRLKLLRKLMQEKKNPTFTPAQFSPSQYSSMTGFEGMNAFTGGYYDATLGDNTDTFVNPWNNIYQSASNTIQERIKLRSLFFNNFIKIAGVIEDLQVKYPKLNIKEISQKDPSHTNKYLKWIVKQLVLGINPNNLYPSIQYFHNNINKFKEKDINRYDGISLEEAIKNLPTQQSKSQEKKQIKTEGAEKIYEDNDYVVLYIKSKQACVSYGANTKWCITMENQNYYEEYTSSNVIFYFIIFKNKEANDPLAKIALAVQRDEDNNILQVECFDALDDKINETEIGIDNSIKLIIRQDAINRPMGMLAKIKNNIATPEEVMQYYRENKENKEILQYLAGMNHTPPNLLADLAKNDDVFIREKVAKNLNTSVDTLKELARDFFPHIRDYVARNPNTPVNVLEEMAVLEKMLRNETTQVRIKK